MVSNCIALVFLTAIFGCVRYNGFVQPRRLGPRHPLADVPSCTSTAMRSAFRGARRPTRAFSSHERAVRQGLHPMTRNLPQRRQRPPVREPDGFSRWSMARNSSPAPQNPRWSGNERALAWPRPRGTSRPGPSQPVIAGVSKSQSFRTPVRTAGRAGNSALTIGDL